MHPDILDNFSPAAVGFDFDGPRSWTNLVSRRPHIRFGITKLDGTWQVRRHCGSGTEDDPIGDCEYKGQINDHAFGCMLLRNMGYPVAFLGHSSSR